MNGSYAIKGYLVQSLVSLLDSFKLDWETVSVEPNDESEKVDIRWTYKNNKKKFVQVKSSKNVFPFSSAEHWANELVEKSGNDVDEYELILVGCVDAKLRGLENNKIGNVLITNRNLSIEDFENLVVLKINEFFETRKEPLIGIKLGRLFAKAMNEDVFHKSIKGESVTRIEFENSLMNALNAVENYLKTTPYSILLRDSTTVNENTESTIIKHILKLIGWDAFNFQEQVKIYDEKLEKDKVFQLDYWGNRDSPLKDNKQDIIYVNADVVSTYPSNFSEEVKKKIDDFNIVRQSLINKNKFNIEETVEHYIQFVLSLAPSENGKQIQSLSDCFQTQYLRDNLIYYTVDNKQIDFIISSIITAREYRKELVTKFLYPITEDNSQMNKIGRRDTYLPPQYINSSILPIVKEDEQKISVLLFCSDPYNKERLKKLIWLLIRLTSGLANDYKIYFSDYDKQYNNEVNEIIRNYKNNELVKKIEIEKLNLCNSRDLSRIPIDISDNLKDSHFDETRNKEKKLRIEPHLIEYLPYGDSLKPFLNSDAILPDDLRLFLKNKGIIFKTAAKTKILQLMTSILFSPIDIESIVDIVNIKDKPLSLSSLRFGLLDKDAKTKDIFIADMITISDLHTDLKADILSFEPKYPQGDDDIFCVTVQLAQKEPTKQALVSTSYSTAKVTAAVDRQTMTLDFIKEHNSKQARIVATRIVKKLSEILIQRGKIDSIAIETKFSDFKNKERVNFLLSFTNIGSSIIFKECDAKLFKYMYDESLELPVECQDKKGKECTMQLQGNKLDTINELQEDTLKEIILAEELKIEYQYNIRGISGRYIVEINFSNALKNKPTPDGLFKFKGVTDIARKDKLKVTSIQKIDSELKNEFRRLIDEKLKEYKKI
ncbi:hypothetical protein [Treponema pedis]|nr:hypothetical protein [Treponema pedis]QSI05760.1 hypothetical protein DYQ05_13025 [Treponema pedis]